MPQYCQNWDTFTENFLKKVKTTTEATQNILPKIKKEIDKWEINLNIGIISAQRKIDEKQRQTPNLTDALQQLWEQHFKPSGVQIAFVMLDDLHYFPIKTEDSAYLNLRTTFQELVNRGCNYFLVVTAHSLLFSEITELAEPLARFFTPFELKSFTENEVKESIDVRLKAVKNTITIDAKIIHVITEKTNGHPYLIMFTMSELLMHAEEKEHIGLKELQDAWPNIEYSLGKMIFS
jgi:hypothetical protein